MKRTWKTLLAGLALAFFAGAALADPPQNVIFDQNQEKLPAGPIGAAVPQPVQFDADNRHNSDTGLQAGAALHILKPVINNNFAFTTVLASGGNFTNNSQNFKYDFDSAISLWLGYTTDSGLGFRATWFRLETDARGISLTNAFAGAAATPFIFAGTFVPFTGVPLAAGQADVFNLSNRIKIDSWDLDVSQQLHICKFDLNVGMGLRYARITQDANISRTRTGLAGGAVNFENELDSNSYNGWGPTAFVEAKRRLGDTGLALYGNARGGVLFGSRHLSVENRATVGGAAPVTTRAFFASDEDRTIGTGELELGIEWHRRCGRYNPFVRFGYEGRLFLNTGSATGGTSDVGAYGFFLSAGVGF